MYSKSFSFLSWVRMFTSFICMWLLLVLVSEGTSTQQNIWYCLLKLHFDGSMKEMCTVYPKKYAHGFCFAVLCCGYTLTDFPISIRLTSLALWQSKDCPSASKATLMNMDKYFMWIHYERLHNHNKAKHNKTMCIFLGIYCNFIANTYSRCYFFPVLTYQFHVLIVPSNEVVMRHNVGHHQSVLSEFSRYYLKTCSINFKPCICAYLVSIQKEK